MFTGIVAAVGRIVSSEAASGGLRLRIDAAGLALDDVAVGDSIAVNGVCLTAVALDRTGFEADVSNQTLDCTAGFPAGAPDGHHLVNRGRVPARYLEVGTRAATEEVHYSDIDMMGSKRDGKFAFRHKNGEPYP